MLNEDNLLAHHVYPVTITQGFRRYTGKYPRHLSLPPSCGSDKHFGYFPCIPSEVTYTCMGVCNILQSLHMLLDTIIFTPSLQYSLFCLTYNYFNTDTSTEKDMTVFACTTTPSCGSDKHLDYIFPVYLLKSWVK